MRCYEELNIHFFVDAGNTKLIFWTVPVDVANVSDIRQVRKYRQPPGLCGGKTLHSPYKSTDVPMISPVISGQLRL